MISVQQIVLMNNVFVLANSDTETNSYFICIIDKSDGSNLLWRKFEEINALDASSALVLLSNKLYITVKTSDNSEMGLIRFDNVEDDS